MPTVHPFFALERGYGEWAQSGCGDSVIVLLPWRDIAPAHELPDRAKPAVQLQEADPALLVLPVGHVVQLPAPAALYVPAAQTGNAHG